MAQRKNAFEEFYLFTFSAHRFALTGAVVAYVLFMLCWSAASLSGSPTHAYVELFTSAEPTSSRALVEGAVWSILIGYVIGGLAAGVYNILGSVMRRVVFHR